VCIVSSLRGLFFLFVVVVVIVVVGWENRKKPNK
jgi:hypothetical protein